jgi:hypothetical protein
MPGALRQLALGMGASPLAGLTTGAAGRLVSAFHAFAALIEADPVADARFGPCFLVSMLSVLRRRGGAPLSEQDEAWVIAEVESELDEARARMVARADLRRSPFPAREGEPA